MAQRSEESKEDYEKKNKSNEKFLEKQNNEPLRSAR